MERRTGASCGGMARVFQTLFYATLASYCPYFSSVFIFGLTYVFIKGNIQHPVQVVFHFL